MPWIRPRKEEDLQGSWAEPAWVSPNQDPSVLPPLESSTHLAPPRSCIPYLRRLPSHRALMPALLWAGSCMLPQCRWMSCCTSAGARQHAPVGGIGSWFLSLLFLFLCKLSLTSFFHNTKMWCSWKKNRYIWKAGDIWPPLGLSNHRVTSHTESFSSPS